MNSSRIHPTKTPAASLQGFTLIELLVTITVIALLAGLTLAAVGGVNQKASRDKAKAEIAAISNALEQFKSVREDYPTNSDTNNFYLWKRDDPTLLCCQ